jgi:hypothetical protein
MTETFAPVVIEKAPLLENRSRGIGNGARLVREEAPPAKIVIEVALSISVTAPGEVEAGTTRTCEM